MPFMRKLLSLTISCFLITNMPSESAAQTVHALKADIVTPQKSKTEFYVRLNHKPKKHNIFFLSNPHRLVIDVMNMDWKAQPLKPTGIIKKIRYGKRANGAGRIVLDLKKQASLGDFNISPHPRAQGKWLLKAVLNHGSVKLPHKIIVQKQTPPASPTPIKTPEKAIKSKPVSIMELHQRKQEKSLLLLLQSHLKTLLPLKKKKLKSHFLSSHKSLLKKNLNLPLNINSKKLVNAPMKFLSLLMQAMVAQTLVQSQKTDAVKKILSCVSPKSSIVKSMQQRVCVQF